MMKFITITVLLTLSLSIISIEGKTQNAYWVFLKDKTEQNFNPYTYFDAKAIQRRLTNNIALSHPTDWPINQIYIEKLKQDCDSILGESRWFNAVAIMANDQQLYLIKKLEFVVEISAINSKIEIASNDTILANEFYSDLAYRQLEAFNAQAFRDAGITGKGVRIAIFDGGFPEVNTSSTFEHIRKNNRLIATWDFTKKQENVYYSIAHGTMVLSNIGGIFKGQALGLATESEFLLAKTEINREPYIEEVHWMEAMEWADKNGADIINSSLGYGSDRYFRSDMNGKKSLVTRAANMAAAKGMLVVNAAGNEGGDKWHIVGAPADADSVLSVGGINPKTLYHINFSSYGPTADGRMKPNVCAFGNTMAVGKKGLENVNGTSFASPLVAGFAACALQANPGIKNMELFELIEKSGSLYPYFDYAHGFGVPQADRAINQPVEYIPSSYNLTWDKDQLWIKDIIFGTNFSSGQLLYINIQDANGLIIYYEVIEVKNNNFKIIDLENLYLKGDPIIINVHFSGVTKSIII
jgi:serine protease AprX